MSVKNIASCIDAIRLKRSSLLRQQAILRLQKVLWRWSLMNDFHFGLGPMLQNYFLRNYATFG
jgi:hypothetical protein